MENAPLNKGTPKPFGQKLGLRKANTIETIKQIKFHGTPPVLTTKQVTFGLCIPRGKCKDLAVQWLLVPLLLVYLRRGGPNFVNHEDSWHRGTWKLRETWQL